MAEIAGTTGAGEGGAHLTPHERRALLEDIGRIAFTLAQSSGALATTNSAPQEAVITVSSARRLRAGAITSPLERLHLLAALWEEMQPALAAILRGADARLINRAQPVMLAQARGGPKTADVAARSPHLAVAWQQFHASNSSPLSSERAPGSLSPESRIRRQAGAHLSRAVVLESRSALSANTWANRLTVRILTDFAREASALGQLANFCEAAPEADTAAQLAKTARNLRAHPTLRDCPPLSDSEAAPAPCANSIARCALPYQIVCHAWRQSTFPLDFDWTHSPLLTLPALEPWRLYEIWCLLQTAAALHQAGWKLTRGELLQATPRGLRLVPATGRASRLDFERKGEKEKRRKGEDSPFLLAPSSFVSLYYQPLFASANQRSARSEGAGKEFAFGSRSHAMQPDMALHSGGRLYILDPKFRPYAQMDDAQVDVNKMHAYRDAIVRRGFDSRRAPSPVEAAWCLFPGPMPGESGTNSEQAENDVYAYPAASREHPFGTAGVGALRLRPGDAPTTKRLAELLMFLLSSV